MRSIREDKTDRERDRDRRLKKPNESGQYALYAAFVLTGGTEREKSRLNTCLGDIFPSGQALNHFRDGSGGNLIHLEFCIKFNGFDFIFQESER